MNRYTCKAQPYLCNLVLSTKFYKEQAKKRKNTISKAEKKHRKPSNSLTLRNKYYANIILICRLYTHTLTVTASHTQCQ